MRDTVAVAELVCPVPLEARSGSVFVTTLAARTLWTLLCDVVESPSIGEWASVECATCVGSAMVAVEFEVSDVIAELHAGVPSVRGFSVSVVIKEPSWWALITFRDVVPERIV